MADRRGLAYSKAAAPTNSAATKAVPERCSKRSMAPAVEGVAEAAVLEPELVGLPELPPEAEPDSELEREPEVLVAREPEVEAAVTKPLLVAEALPEVPVLVLVLVLPEELVTSVERQYQPPSAWYEILVGRNGDPYRLRGHVPCKCWRRTSGPSPTCHRRHLPSWR